MVQKRYPGRSHLPRGLGILYEDEDLLVVDKPAGRLTVGTAMQRERQAHAVLTDYVRKGCAKSRKRIFIVHRLDQWTSGVLIFAKSEAVKERLQEKWKDTEKMYLAVVHGRLSPAEGVIRSYLAENRAYKVYSTKNAGEGKLSQTAYRVLEESGQYSLVEVRLLTGRKNQIRVHRADHGNPVVGDRKYGYPDDGQKRLALHARSISFTHPVSGERMTFEAAAPEFFSALLKRKPGRGKPVL